MQAFLAWSNICSKGQEPAIVGMLLLCLGRLRPYSKTFLGQERLDRNIFGQDSTLEGSNGMLLHLGRLRPYSKTSYKEENITLAKFFTFFVTYEWAPLI